MKNENKTKKTWDKDFFIYNKRYHWFIIPTFVFFYRKDVFLESGVYTPAWGFTFRWLTIMIGVQFQQSYKIVNE